MLRKGLISLLFAVTMMALLVGAVMAQTDGDEESADAAPSIQPLGGGIVQAIPLTLTVSIPGPDGAMTVEVPIVLSLDIQIALGNVLTTSVVVSAEVSDADEAEAVETEPTAVRPTSQAVTPTPVPPTPVPPTPVPATPTSAPAQPTAAPTEAAPTAEPEPTEEPTAAPPEEETPVPDEPREIDPDACSDPRSVIFAPEAGAVISGTLEVYGTARHELFNYYKLEYLQDGSPTGDYAFIMDSSAPVTDGLLAALDTTELDNGGYTLRLTVVDNTGNFPPQCLVPVEVAN